MSVAPRPTSATTPDTTVAPATGAPDDVWLVVQGDDGNRTLIDAIDAAGAHVHLAAELAGGDQTNPDWSPDGTKVTFGATGDDGRDDLWIADLAGGQPELLFDCAEPCDYVDDAAWTPDGGSVAVCLMRAEGDDHLGSLVAIDAATGALTTLAEFAPEDFCAGPRWAPDGSRVVAEVVHRTDTSLRDMEVTGVTLSVIHLDPSPPTVTGLTDPAVFAATADWSPDGSRIVYSALPTADAQVPQLFTIAPDGRELTPLTAVGADGASAAIEPTYAPDGTSIVFVADGDDPALLRIPTSGGEPEPLDVTCPCNHPRFRPGS